MDWTGYGQGGSADHNGVLELMSCWDTMPAVIIIIINAIHNNETDRRVAGIGNTSNLICLLKVFGLPP